MDSEIVISGISGRYPRSRNVKEFAENLYGKVDMIDDDESRWEHFNDEVPKRFGKVPNLKKFDASFFSMLNKHANWTDPQMRTLLEHSYEAMLDAGVSPQSLIGSRTGVFIGNSETDSKDVFAHQIPTKEGHVMAGNAGFYLPNKISYSLGLQGPSMRVDSACSSSAYALNYAVQSIKNGLCDSAIVGGASLILTFITASEFYRGKVLSHDGFSRPFDEKAEGFVRAEAIGVVFIQKQTDAKRIYASIVGSSVNNDGFKMQGSTFPSRALQEQLMRDIFAQTCVNPNEIGFVEAHATGTITGDCEEVSAIDAVFCENRNQPLPIGSVKSNMGHAEAASGFASLFKVLLAFENRKIPPNINLTALRMDIDAFKEGRIRVVTDPEDLKGNFISMNSFGIGGSNAHFLFKGNEREKINGGVPGDDLKRLVCWSGRSEDAIKGIFDDVAQRALDAEFVALLQSSQEQTNFANNFRGFGLFQQNSGTNKAELVQQKIANFNGNRKAIVWCFNGIGSQWPGMGADLMRISIFADSIEKCHQILATRNFDLKKVVTRLDEKFENVLNSYAGIVAMEIALVNVLKAVGLEPDFMIGHSLGEIGCSYADNCLSLEQAILIAFERGRACNESKNIHGAMAAVGIGHEELQKILPDDVDVACHNSSDLSTITGPVASVQKFMQDLSAKGIFTKEVQSSGVALHSRYISNYAELFNASIKTMLENPKKRSAKWISSTYPESQWDSEECQFVSAEYNVKNLTNPVLFEEAMRKIPSNALVIEIGPHALLKSVLKRSLKDAVLINPTQRNDLNGCDRLMSSIGEIFMNGYDVKISNLYPQISFPVSRGTPMISSLIKWNHEENFTLPIHDRCQFYQKQNIAVNLSDKNFSFVADHVIDGKVLIPGTLLICLVWKSFNLMYGNLNENMKVEFEDVKLTRITIVEENQDILVNVSINRGTGFFEVTEKSSLLAQGYIRKSVDHKTRVFPKNPTAPVTLSESDFYKEMRLRGYNHKGVFRGVHEVMSNGLGGKLKWLENWTTFIDTLLQVFILMDDTRGLVLPTYFGKIVIDVDKHLKVVNDEGLVEFFGNKNSKSIIAGGVEIYNFDGSEVARRHETSKPLLETYKFIPNFPTETFSFEDVAKITVQLLSENNQTLTLKCIEVDANDEFLCSHVQQAIKEVPSMKYHMTILTEKDSLKELENVEIEHKELSEFQDVDLIISRNSTDDCKFLESAKKALKPGGFLMIYDSQNAQKISKDFQVACNFKLENSASTFLLQKPKLFDKTTLDVIKISENVADWLEPLKSALNSKAKIIAYAQNEQISGILGLVNCIRREPNGNKLICFFIDDENAPKFNLENSFYKSQLDLGFAINIYRSGRWGTYKHLSFEPKIEASAQEGDCYLKCLTKGDLSTLSWVQGSLDPNHSDNVRVCYCSLNFKDLMLALGRITPNVDTNRIDEQRLLGVEWSGVMNDGRRLFGLPFGGALSTVADTTVVPPLEVPAHWTLEEAVTVPIVYFTVYAAFFVYSNIRAGETVLIHSGAGGVGQAALHIAFAYGLEVFTTVGSAEKREYLLKKYPQLKPENIGNSRDTSFEEMIMLNTNGVGVKYVLNSLSGDKLIASIKCLSKRGRLLEIGKFDMMNRTKIDLRHFTKNISFSSIFIENLLNDPAGMVIYDQLRADIKRGIVKPLDSTVFTADKIEDAFRYMANGKHIGKILIKMREDENDIATLPMKVNSNVFCYDSESFVVVGGLGGFGLELADLLVLRGCKSLILNSSRGITSSYQEYRIETWKSYGVNVVVSTADITTKSGCQELLNDSSIAGIFNLAVNLQDAPLEEQTAEMFEASLAPKALATKHLDEVSRSLCPSLRYFVVFSSVSCGKGNRNQSNYGMANSIMERIIEQRHREGLPAKAIQWGAVGDTGLLANLIEKTKNFKLSGTLPQGISSCLNTFDVLIDSKEPILSSVVVAENDMSFGKKKNFIEIIMNILGFSDKKSVPMDVSLSKLGIDSLMGVEIQQVLEREYDLNYSAQELRSVTLRQLEKRVLMKESEENEDKKDVIDFSKFFFTQIGDESKKDETVLKINECGDTKMRVLIIPGFEGIPNNSLNAIAEQLECSTYILQLNKSYEASSIQEILNVIWNDIVDVFTDCEKFLIIGYSFGSMLALKIAKMLEAFDKEGEVVMLDGSPELLMKLTKIFVPPSDEEFMKTIVSIVIKALNSTMPENSVTEILKEKTFKEQYAKFQTLSSNEILYSADHVEKMIEGLKNRAKMSLVDQSLPVLEKTKITLLKASEISLPEVSDDYGLKNFTSTSVKVQSIPGNHLTILKNDEVVKILNEKISSIKLIL